MDACLEYAPSARTCDSARVSTDCTGKKRLWFSIRQGNTARKRLGRNPRIVHVHAGSAFESAVGSIDRLRLILEHYAQEVEIAGAGSFFLNVRSTELSLETKLRRMQMEILGRTGLRVSVGVGITKVMASIASRVEKTGGLRIVNVGSEQLFLALLPVTKLHGIGQIDAIALGGRGISTIGQLRSLPKPVLTAAFGQSLGVELWNSARGRETAPRRPKRNWVLTLRVAKQRTLAQLTRIAGRLAAAFGKVASATPSAG